MGITRRRIFEDRDIASTNPNDYSWGPEEWQLPDPWAYINAHLHRIAPEYQQGFIEQITNAPSEYWEQILEVALQASNSQTNIFGGGNNDWSSGDDILDGGDGSYHRSTTLVFNLPQINEAEEAETNGETNIFGYGDNDIIDGGINRAYLQANLPAPFFRILDSGYNVLKGNRNPYSTPAQRAYNLFMFGDSITQAFGKTRYLGNVSPLEGGPGEFFMDLAADIINEYPRERWQLAKHFGPDHTAYDYPEESRWNYWLNEQSKNWGDQEDQARLWWNLGLTPNGINLAPFTEEERWSQFYLWGQDFIVGLAPIANARAVSAARAGGSRMERPPGEGLQYFERYYIRGSIEYKMFGWMTASWELIPGSLRIIKVSDASTYGPQLPQLPSGATGVSNYPLLNWNFNTQTGTLSLLPQRGLFQPQGLFASNVPPQDNNNFPLVPGSASGGLSNNPQTFFRELLSSWEKQATVRSQQQGGVEVGSIWDAKTGKLLLDKVGIINELPLTQAEKLLMKGNIFTHTHRASLSRDDFLTIITYLPSEYRGTTPNQTYVIKPKGQWPDLQLYERDKAIQDNIGTQIDDAYFAIYLPVYYEAVYTNPESAHAIAADHTWKTLSESGIDIMIDGQTFHFDFEYYSESGLFIPGN